MLDPAIAELARGANFAAFTVLLPSGWPSTNVMWVDATRGRLLINTEIHRLKYRAVEADARVAVTIWDAADPYRYGEVRGHVVERVLGERALRHADELSRKYNGRDYPRDRIVSERVVLEIEPRWQRTW